MKPTIERIVYFQWWKELLWELEAKDKQQAEPREVQVILLSSSMIGSQPITSYALHVMKLNNRSMIVVEQLVTIAKANVIK